MGMQKEKNLTVGFRVVFDAPTAKRVILRVTASIVYRAFLNGSFWGYGPARGPHDHFRVDEYDLTDDLRSGKNLVAIEVAGYNVNSYYLLDQPAFLQAEVLSGDDVLASTAGTGARFEAGILRERVQKVQRYSFQRPFSEVYRLRPGYDRWRKEIAAQFETVECSVFPDKKLLPRRVPYPNFHLRYPLTHILQGTVETGIKVEHLWNDRSLTGIGPPLGGFAEGELEVIPSIELQKVGTVPDDERKRPFSPEEKLQFTKNSYHLVDFGTNLTGFLGAKITSRNGARLFLTFDEILSNGDVDFKRLSCVNIVSYEIPPGTFVVESFEPYTLRYLKLAVLDGDCEIEKISLREYANPEVEKAHFAASDERLNRIFAAGRETFRQNAVDIFTDCPSRERVGWLCDTFFTSRVAPDLSGNTRVEENFLENFLLPERFAHLPEGMLPMCYPADHNDGVYIPNWVLWFVIQLEEYGARSGDWQMVEAFRPKVMRLFDYFRPFKNEDGLLEKLDSWVFVEWSEANRFVQDVNYSTNMLYAAALAAAGRMYGNSAFLAEANRIREAIRGQSFDGNFFVDNSVRKAGKLEATRNRSEVCQYFAFYFDIASPETYSDLRRVLRDRFGPQRERSGGIPGNPRSQCIHWQYAAFGDPFPVRPDPAGS